MSKNLDAAKQIVVWIIEHKATEDAFWFEHLYNVRSSKPEDLLNDYKQLADIFSSAVKEIEELNE